MEDKIAQLSWGVLKQTEGDIPWPALYEFAAAIINDSSISDALFELYEQALESGFDNEHYEEFYVPVIFALAAPQLSDRRRCEIGTCLLEKLSDAGQEDDDILLEVLTAACGSMGPVVLPAVLETIAREPNHEGAWYHLYGLTQLAVKSDDFELRERVIQACMDLLTQANRGKIAPIDTIDAAWTLAAMKYTQCSNLLKRLEKKSKTSFCHAEYRDALKLLEGRLDYTPLPKLWERPVKEWFEPRWQIVKDWYTEEQGKECEELEWRAAELADRFTESQAARKLDSELFEDANFIAYHVLDYAWIYVGSSPEELDEYTLKEVLLEIFPRKLTAERDLFEKVAPITAGFLKWLESEGILANTSGLIKNVYKWKDAIVANGMNPKYWSMAKTLMMRARANGIDTQDMLAVQRYFDEYDLELIGQDFFPEFDQRSFSPPIPIVEQSPKIGRNAPCPCGSGRKYKKCCGGIKGTEINH